MAERKKILIVEDEDIIKALILKFESAGFEVDTARDGLEAMDKLRNAPDVVLLDILIPKLDGFEILKRMQADSRLRDIPVFVFSNFSDPAYVGKAESFGVIGYVVKADTNLSDLVGKIVAYFK